MTLYCKNIHSVIYQFLPIINSYQWSQGLNKAMYCNNSITILTHLRAFNRGPGTARNLVGFLGAIIQEMMDVYETIWRLPTAPWDDQHIV